MDKEKFRQHFDNSIKLLVDFTRQQCYNDISLTFLFIVQPSGTDIHDDLDELERRNLTVLNQTAKRPWTFDQVIVLLCHDDRVPLWINTTIYECKQDLTVIHLLCSRRLRDDSQLYYKAVKYPPFNIQVPVPPALLRNDIDGKFDINWKKKLDDKIERKVRKKKSDLLFFIDSFCLNNNWRYFLSRPNQAYIPIITIKVSFEWMIQLPITIRLKEIFKKGALNEPTTRQVAKHLLGLNNK